MSASHVTWSTRGQRVKKAGAALGLTAAVTLGGIALASPANAATTPKIPVFSTPANQSYSTVWYSAWGWAWDICRAQRPQTRSVQLVSYSLLNSSGETRSWWLCRDTP